MTRFKALILIGTSLGVGIFLLLIYLIPKIGGISNERIGMAGRYAPDELPHFLQELISDGLTDIAENGEVLPNLAETWDTPDKGKTWVFRIKDNATWQDGKKVVTRDLGYEFSDATIAFPDDLTITFSLQSPYSAFPSVVAKPVFKKGLLGTGEWRVKNLTLAGDYVDKVILINKEGIRKTYRFFPTEERAKLAFQMGQIDTIRDLLDPSPLSDWQNIKSEKNVNKGEYVAIFFNTTDKILADKTVRQALYYATQKENLGGTRALSAISSNSWAFNPQVKPYSYDLNKAKSMINALPAEAKSDLNITLTTSPILLPQAELIKKDWEAVGFKVTTQVMTNVPSSYQAIMAIYDVPDDPDQYTLWHSTQSQTNITHYANPRIDKLLEDGRTNTDSNTRRQIYLDFQRYLLEDAPAMFLYYPASYTFKR